MARLRVAAAGPPRPSLGRQALNSFPAFPDDSYSLLKKYLTRDVWAQLNPLRTRSGVSLQDCIHSGVTNVDSEVGLYAGDADSYTVFTRLFAPVIADCHPGFVIGAHRSELVAAHVRPANPDPDGKYILSTRMRVARNLRGYNLRPTTTSDEDLDVERKAKAAFKQLSGDLAGHYQVLAEMGVDGDSASADGRLGFTRGDRFQDAAGLNRNWSIGRGFFSNQAKSFTAWVNEEDQLRLISVQRGADIATVFARLCRAMDSIENTLEFQRSDDYGFLCSCPTNLGTGLRASFHLRLPLSGGSQDFREICRRRYLTVRSSSGEHSPGAQYVYEISNKRRLGLSEAEALHECLEGIMKLIALEKSFAARL